MRRDFISFAAFLPGTSEGNWARMLPVIVRRVGAQPSPAQRGAPGATGGFYKVTARAAPHGWTHQHTDTAEAERSTWRGTPATRLGRMDGPERSMTARTSGATVANLARPVLPRSSAEPSPPSTGSPPAWPGR